MMTRDSIVFSWLAVVVAIAGYLALGDPPTQWDFKEWMQAIVAVGGIVSGKLGSSPLPHSDDGGHVTPR
jgi:hypothetical protein